MPSVLPLHLLPCHIADASFGANSLCQCAAPHLAEVLTRHKDPHFLRAKFVSQNRPDVWSARHLNHLTVLPVRRAFLYIGGVYVGLEDQQDVSELRVSEVALVQILYRS